jgi:hypothetical protein
MDHTNKWIISDAPDIWAHASIAMENGSVVYVDKCSAMDVKNKCADRPKREVDSRSTGWTLGTESLHESS